MLILAGPTGADEHVGPDGHPERPSRIGAVMAGVADLQLGAALAVVSAPLAPPADLARVHAPAYLAALEAFCAHGGGDLDPDTFATAGSWDAARRVAGAGLCAITSLRAQGDGVALVAGRPPGHHAARDRAMGFCLLNNVAVAAASLSALGERVLIVDWDVHHGNGTQSIFWDDPSVLFVSTHQWPLFPGTGRAQEVGGPHAVGLTVNVPVPPGATGDVLDLALERVARPVVERFAPDWVLVSCGFDAHRSDPLAELALSAGDFARLALAVREFAPRPGRLVLFLEGGYDLAAIRASVTGVLGALLGRPTAIDAPTFGGPGADMVQAAAVSYERAVARARDAPAT